MASFKVIELVFTAVIVSLFTFSVFAQSNHIVSNPLNKQIAEIDVLFVYANTANDSFDGGAESWINQLVALTNQAMIDSNVYIRINNVGMQAVEYPANVNFTDALVDIQAGVHEGLIDIDNLRYELGADVVSFVVASDDQCGEAFGNFQIAGKAHEMYHVIGIGCPDNIFAHEIGHNLGLSHSRPQDATGGFTFEYALGHGLDSSFATIMTYAHFFNVSTEAVMQYSNSENACNGYPCGVGREKAGESADAAYALNQIRFQAQDLYDKDPSLTSGISALSNIVDVELRSCIEEHLNSRKIRYAGALHKLECLNRQITSVSGIEHFPSITSLNLSNNQLESLIPLSRLTQISELYLSNTDIDQIGALSELVYLNILNITDNKISDISALSDLQYLQDLDLNNNKIASLASLAIPERRWRFLNASANIDLMCWHKAYFTQRFTDSVFFSDDTCNPLDDDNDYDSDGVDNTSETNNGSNPFVSSIADGYLIFSKPVFRINEGDQQVIISVKRTSGSQPISASLSASSDSGLVNSDVFIVDQDFVLPGAQDDLQIIADIDDDAQLEFVERIVVRLAQNNAPDTYATIVIDDNEQALQWTETDIQVNESDENAVLTVELLRSTEKDASVAYTIKPITAFFGNGNDYLLERGSIDIATGQTLAVLNIPIYQDNFEEPTETFMVTLFDPTNANLGEQTVSIVTINDDDATEPPSPIVPPVATPSSSGGTVGLAWLFLLYFGITRRFGKH